VKRNGKNTGKRKAANRTADVFAVWNCHEPSHGALGIDGEGTLLLKKKGKVTKPSLGEACRWLEYVAAHGGGQDSSPKGEAAFFGLLAKALERGMPAVSGNQVATAKDTFSEWLKQVPKLGKESEYTINLPITLTMSDWFTIAQGAAHHGWSVEEVVHYMIEDHNDGLPEWVNQGFELGGLAATRASS
jgi:hypothetical protein